MKRKALSAAVFYSLMLLSSSAVLIGTADVSWANHYRYGDRPGGGMTDFRRFLRNHPGIDSDLQRDPSLINNPRYLNRHDDLRDFLRDHPRVADEFLNRSYRAGSRARSNRWDDYRGPWGWGYRR